MLEMDGQTVALAPPRRALPLSEPEQFIVLSDSDGNELGIVRDLSKLEPASREVLQEALQRTYVIERITRILEVEKEPLTGQTRWRVEIAANDRAQPHGTVRASNSSPNGSPNDSLVEVRNNKKKVLAQIVRIGRRAKASDQGNAPEPGDKVAHDKVVDAIATQEREFFINGQEDVQAARYPHIYIVDVEGNRYEIPDCESLDLDSRRAAERFF